MRIHLINLPHTQTTKAFGQCAYTQKVRKFSTMMTGLGHQVYLYASEENEANCTELISCVSREEQLKWHNKSGVPADQYYKFPFNGRDPLWKKFNREVLKQLKLRVQRGDLICITAGLSHKEIIKQYPYSTIEYAVGYEGIAAKYRIFESYAWMHHVYGLMGIREGNPLDGVIHNYYEISDFPFSPIKADYLLFLSRPIKSKGIDVALKISQETGLKLVVAGAEKVEGENVEWVGYADARFRGDLMTKARAVLCPTLNIEPFGGVVAEAQLCGTPVITTDWGAFTETVEQGKTGIRCRTMGQFREATKMVEALDPYYIARRAAEMFSADGAAAKYQDYFNRLQGAIAAAPLLDNK